MKFLCSALSFLLLIASVQKVMAQAITPAASGPWSCWVECPDPSEVNWNLKAPKKKIKNPTKVKIPLNTERSAPLAYGDESVPVIAQECNAGGDTGPEAVKAIRLKVGGVGATDCCAKADIKKTICGLPTGATYPIDYFQVPVSATPGAPVVAPAAK